MKGFNPRRHYFSFSVIASSGTMAVAIPGATTVGDVRGYSGLLQGVGGRIDTGGGWTFSGIGFAVVDASQAKGVASPFTSAQADELVVFDSGTISVGAGTPSATNSFFMTDLGANPEIFSHGLVVQMQWTTSAGSGTSVVNGWLELLEAVPG
jgi:hypothetical protein